MHNEAGVILLVPVTHGAPRALPASCSHLAAPHDLVTLGRRLGGRTGVYVKSMVSSLCTWQRGAGRESGRQRKATSLPLEPGCPAKASMGGKVWS